MGGAGSGSEHPQRVGKFRASRGTPAAHRHAACADAQHALRHPGIPIPGLPLGSAEPRGAAGSPIPAAPRRPGALSTLPGSCRPSGLLSPAAGREGKGSAAPQTAAGPSPDSGPAPGAGRRRGAGAALGRGGLSAPGWMCARRRRIGPGPGNDSGAPAVRSCSGRGPQPLR